jgi:NAD(P)H-nitrite reductase large subunit
MMYLSTLLVVAWAFLPSNAFVVRQQLSTSKFLQQPLYAHKKNRIVVVGNGMVGQRFMETLLELDKDKTCLISTICEEPRAAYNRVRLTSYFESKDPSALSMTSDFRNDGSTVWYDENGVELFVKDKAVKVDTERKVVMGESGREIPYDTCVMATGSVPFVSYKDLLCWFGTLQDCHAD